MSPALLESSGVPLVTKGAFIRAGCSSCSMLPSWQISGQSGRKWAKTGQKQRFICLFLSHLGKIGDNKRQKPNIFLKCGCKVGAGCGSACLPFGVSTGAGLHALYAILLTLAKMDGMPPDAQPFCPLSRSACGVLCLNMALFRVLRAFLGGFMCFVWVCVAWVICVACVAFVRVWS